MKGGHDVRILAGGGGARGDPLSGNIVFVVNELCIHLIVARTIEQAGARTLDRVRMSSSSARF